MGKGPIGIFGCIVMFIIASTPTQASLGHQPTWIVKQIAQADARDYAYMQTLRLMRSLEGVRGARERYERAIELWQQWPPSH